MSLRADYLRTISSTTLTRKLAAVSKTLAHDVAVVRECQTTRGLSATFALLKSAIMPGAWSRRDNTLTYTLAQDDVALEHINYTRLLAGTRAANRDWMLMECKSAVMDDIISRRLPRAQAQIEQTLFHRHARSVEYSPAYQAIQALCADANVNARLELCVSAASLRQRAREGVDFFIDIDGCVIARPRLELRIHLDQPYQPQASKVTTAPHRVKLG